MGVSLVIMAAGIGSRFGGGIKQLTSVGPNGEIIIDYSIHDALEAGFDKVVFIIRKDLEKDFREIIGNRIEKICNVEYVFQELDMLPDGYEKPADRTKPWGTGQAVLCCKNVVKEPFAVINADDYYGKEAFKKVYTYLNSHTESKHEYCMAGFILDNTLSDNGTVTRGVCRVDEEENLIQIDETKGIQKNADGIIRDENDNELLTGTHVSMNMWGLTSEFIEILDKGFKEFLSQMSEDDIKAEYLLPTIIGDLLEAEKISVKVLETTDKWFGVTYQEDKQTVIDAFSDLIKKGIYKTPLYN
ncbi:UDP-N-acetylglucosamine diphosphorylase/glucosamine-1-phosphate N-acetyltransferase [uncultured Roseburia sp.]|uniref:Sugar phosphate nucleotidyltransferase n=1 Tax=Brotonthovivens ammoniilytica TaxID=2981725 RepID=A0ABT2TF69_9FIRM|nr:sugar phosphate nucleotidyltransferase [Brotonthovivens ammoniilytica]MCU6760825.1 sugar phosphate nucleotidyltransferase [Brotonthovivens ammoniilytica]SCI10485.1 UDP-N-acetylglucosamine diphosphorylase/glucosamine-1-phosphate N-acetyltransferase [uncultured Roseburia sp.]